MKKVRIILFVLILSVSLGSQVLIDGVDINTAPGIEYCKIVGYGKMLSSKMVIYVDYGQKRKFLSNVKKFYLKDKEDKKIIFYSMVQALNFMYDNGWEFVHCFTVTEARGLGKATNVYHFLLRRNK